MKAAPNPTFSCLLIRKGGCCPRLMVYEDPALPNLVMMWTVLRHFVTRLHLCMVRLRFHHVIKDDAGDRCLHQVWFA
jgi:hypothetical protein